MWTNDSKTRRKKHLISWRVISSSLNYKKKTYSADNHFNKTILMNRDTTIIQVAILMIALAILGIAIWRQQNVTPPSSSTSPIKIQEQIRGNQPVVIT